MLLELLVNEQKEAERNKIIKMLTDSSDNLLETLDNLNEVVAINTNLDKKLFASRRPSTRWSRTLQVS